MSKAVVSNRRQFVLRALIVVLLAGTLPLAESKPAEADPPAASPWDPTPLQPFQLPTAATAPPVRILMMSSGIHPAALPQGMKYNQLDGGWDMVGWGTAAASLMAAIYPADKITVDSLNVHWSADGCIPENYGGNLGDHIYDALSGRGSYAWGLRGVTPETLAATYDAVLIDAPTHCVTPTPAWMLSRANDGTGHRGNDALLSEIATHPIDASRTQDPSKGPALSFDAMDLQTGFTPVGWGGGRSSRTPYHDASPQISALAGSAKWNYYDRVVSLIDRVSDLGLPVIVPAGDAGWTSTRPDRRAWQSIGGLAMLDSVITVGSASTTGDVSNPDQGWALAASSSLGPTWGGRVKPDLLAPGFGTVMVAKDSYMYWRAQCGNVTTVWVCGQQMKAVLPYVPQNPGAADTLTAAVGFGASQHAAAIVAIQAAQLRARWPNGRTSDTPSLGALKSLLQAKAIRLIQPGPSGMPPAPYEQGAGVLTEAPQPEDVGRYSLLSEDLSLPVSDVKCPESEDCKTRDFSFYQGSAAPTGVTNTTSHLMAVDLAGIPRNYQFASSGDPEPVTFTARCDPGPTCTVKASLTTPVSYAGLDCGWMFVASAEGALPAKRPYCWIRGLTLDFYMYFPWVRPLSHDIVSLDVYFPGYLYVTSPFHMFTMPDPTYGRLPSNIPPYITIHQKQTDSNGRARLYNVAPGIYDYRPYGGYNLPEVIGRRDLSGSACSEMPCYETEETGGRANFQHTPPLVVPSPLPCSELPRLPWRLSTDSLMPLCRPDESGWHVTGERDDPIRRWVHEPGWYDDDTDVCLLPVGEIESVYRGGTRLVPAEWEASYKSVGFVCGDVQTRFGTGVSSHRVRTLRTGVFSAANGSGNATFKYPAIDKDGTPSTYSDFDLRECLVSMDFLESVGEVDINKSPADLVNPGTCPSSQTLKWEFGKCPTCTVADNMGDYTRLWGSSREPITTSTNTVDPVNILNAKSKLQIPIAIAHTKFGVFTPNYETHVELNMGVDVKNALVLVMMTVGDARRYALMASVSPAEKVTVGGGDPAADKCDEWLTTTVTTYGCAGRRTAEWDFRSLGANHGDMWIVVVPTALGGDSYVNLSDIELVVDTFDKVPFTRGPRDPQVPNEFIIEMNTNLGPADIAKFGPCSTCTAVASWPFCNKQTDCDEMRVFFGTPKGPTWVTQTMAGNPPKPTPYPYVDDTCAVDDVFTGAGLVDGQGRLRADERLAVEAWDPDPFGLVTGTPVSQIGLPAVPALGLDGKPILDAYGLPLLSTSDYKYVNNHFIGAVSIPFQEIRKRPGPFTAFFGAFPSAGQPDCKPDPPENYPAKPSASTCYQEVADFKSGPPREITDSPNVNGRVTATVDVAAPYSITPPGYCFFSTKEKSMTINGYASGIHLIQKLKDQGLGQPPRRCFYYYPALAGAFWSSWLYRGMQPTC